MEENFALPYRPYIERPYIYLVNLICGDDVRNKLYLARVLFLKTQLTSAAPAFGRKNTHGCILRKVPVFFTENSMGAAERDR